MAGGGETLTVASRCAEGQPRTPGWTPALSWELLQRCGCCHLETQLDGPPVRQCGGPAEVLPQQFHLEQLMLNDQGAARSLGVCVSAHIGTGVGGVARTACRTRWCPPDERVPQVPPFIENHYIHA